MITSYIQKRGLTPLNSAALARLYPPAEDRAAWMGLAPEEKRQIQELADRYAPLPYPMRLATGMLAFSRSGSRKADEDPYFLRRRKLCAAALACCLDPEAPLDGVIDGVWCLCEETSWVISAHFTNPIPGANPREHLLPDPADPYIDLFSAQTGMILALVVHLLGSRLDGVSPLLRSRIRESLEARILRPFMQTDDFWWMGVKRQDLNNWTPWILSNIFVCACLQLSDEAALAALLARGCVMLDRWLSRVPPDGGCDEGAGYWNMAGGALLDCLEILETVTEGRIKCWEEEKIRNILSFPLKAEIGGGWFLNFADCDARPFLSGERLQLAGEKLEDPALAALGLRLRGTLEDQLSDVPHFTRLLRLLFHPAGNGEGKEAEKGDVWLPDLQVRLVRRGSLALCCKGGTNGESHNHNDVGSFMLYVENQPEIVDAGNAVYTAQTFSDRRYALWHVRGAYHNLPLIGGEEQRQGKAFAARNVCPLPDGLRLDLSAAYGPEADVKELTRELRLAPHALTLRDTAVLGRPQPITWVLMLRHEPVQQGGAVQAGSIRFALPEDVTAQAEEIPITDPRMARSFPGSLWRLLLAAPPAPRHEFILRIEENRYASA